MFVGSKRNVFSRIHNFVLLQQTLLHFNDICTLIVLIYALYDERNHSLFLVYLTLYLVLSNSFARYLKLFI